ncbi:iron chelate uptake ABC transporter family permease subunit [Nocardia beijingensis]|uniref:iron chelate uptake ABC transporter family permease subunit n=1 Tax=Nocardia beijingensis TaxID=95162 RepID=UPI000A81221B
MTSLATVRRRRLSGLLVSTVLLLLAVLAGVAVGARSLAPGTVYDAVHHALTCPGGPFTCAAGSTEEEIVRGLRLPRTALALVCGAALGIAGALVQCYTRNPLADAGLLGLNAGAAFLAALSVYLFAFSAPEQYIWFALTGALIAGIAVFATSSVGGGKAGPLTLVLAGAAVTAFLQAMTNAVVLFDAAALDTYRFWVIGTVAGRDAAVFWQVLPFLAAGMLLAVLAAPGLNLIGLGDDVARGLGVHVGRSRALGLAAVVLLAGGDGGGRADRLPRPGRSASRADDHRTGSSVADSLFRALRRVAAADRRCGRPSGGSPRRAGGRRGGRRARRAVLPRVRAQAKAGEPVTISLRTRSARPALRVGPVSTVLRPRMILIVAAAIALALALFCLDIAVGESHLPLGRVLDVLTGGGTRAQRFIVLESRLPRALTALVVGLALGLAGAITQSILHNPLAAPDMLGITSGASLGAVAVLVGTGGASTGLAASVGAPVAALAGGLLTAVAIYLLAWGRTATGAYGATGLRLVLIGVGVNALLTAGISWLLTRASLADAQRVQLWLNGSLNAADTAHLTPAAIAAGIAALVALAAARTLAALRLGSDTTRALGVRVQTQQAILIGAAVVAASVATAAVGPVGFVALAAPQIARRLLRTPGEPLVGSAVTGAILVVGADVASRTVFPVDLPLGVVTAALGGPFLLYLLVRMNRKATLS